MKLLATTLMMSALTLAAAPAFAQSTLSCTSAGVADAGFSVVFNQADLTATIAQETIAGPQGETSLACTPLMIPHIEMPGMVIQYVRCVDSSGTKIVYMTSTEGKNSLNADVKTLSGSQEVLLPLGHLNCSK